MKSRTLILVIAITLLAALSIPIQVSAQEQNQKTPRYSVADLGTLGGTFGEANALNNKAWVVGDATLPGDTVRHAFLWRKGLMKNLGTLGGPNSLATALNERGEVTGFSDTSTPDPLTEDFCFFGTNLRCLPFLWREGVLTPLPTLGGSGQAFEINSRGQVVGVSENTTPDPTCVDTPQVLNFEPVLWEKGETIHELPTFPGDPDGVADAINDRGQAVGQTGDCINPFHGVLWDHDTVVDLGKLGELQLAPRDINNQAQVVGFAFSPTTLVAFLWQNGVATNLGTLPPDVFSFALGINEKGQIVGDSCDMSFACRAFLWEDGTMTELNSLVHDPDAPFLENGNGINSRGQIAGKTTVQGTPIADAFLATPSHGEAANETASPARHGQTSQRPKVVLPENVRQFLQQRLGFSRFIRAPQLPLGKTAVTSAPTVTLSPTTLSFPAQVLGTASQAKTVTLKNTGNASLTITGIAITGSNPGSFAQTHTCGGSLAVGASCTISVKFKPTMVGPRSAALSISDNAAGSPQKVPLSGTGVVSGPNATLSPASLTFADQLVGTTSAGKSLKLSNYGTATLNITSITASSDFSQTHTCGLSLAPLASCTISVIFKPTQIGVRTGTLSVADNAAGSPQTNTVNGTGVVSGPNATLSPTKLIFECRNVINVGCQCITGNKATLSNFGTKSLDITNVTITGPFTEGNNCGAILGPGKSCAAQVRWSETNGGGSLTFFDNASASPQAVSLFGEKLCTPP
jgi:probable HAF family extracellular repeat protein